MSTHWHDEARELLNSGLSINEIGARMRRTPSSLRWALDIDGERQKSRDRVNARRQGISRRTRLREHVRAAKEPAAEYAQPPLRAGITLPFVSFLADHESPAYQLAPRDYFARASA